MRIKHTIYLFIFITIGLGLFSVSQLRMNTDIESYNLASEQEIQNYRSFVNKLKTGNKHYSIVILEKQLGWSSLEDFRMLKEIAEFWESEPQIKSVSSIVNLKYPKQGLFRTRKVPFLDLDNKKRLEKRLGNYDKFIDIFQKFISENRKYTLLFLETDEGILSSSAQNFENLKHENDGIKIHYLQYDLIEQELKSYLQKDSLLLGIISLMLILGGFYYFTHSLKGLGLIALMVVFNISVAFIFMFAFSIDFTMQMVTVPCLIVVLSFTDIMHILYYQEKFRAETPTNPELRQRIITEVRKPLILTSFTNIIGFVVFLLVSENLHLFNYALISIIGVFTAYLSSRFLVIRLMNRKSEFIKKQEFQFLNSIHVSVLSWLSARKKIVFATFGVLFFTVLCFVVSFFRIDNSDQEFSVSNAKLTNGKEILEREFFGKNQAEIFITTQNDGIWNKPILSKMEEVEQEINRIFEPLYINSPTLIVKRYNRYTSGGRAENFFIPKKLGKRFKRDLATYKNSLGGDGIIDTNSQKARIVFGFAHSKLENLRAKYMEIQEILEKNSDLETQFQLTGLQYLSDEATYSFSNKILLGFGISILFGSIFIWFSVKSTRISLVLLLINLFPILVALAIILLLNISITPLTLFLLSILLGVCLDDSIYLVSQNTEKSEILHALPIFITSLVLSLGFLSLSFSSFTWLKPFGWIFLIGIWLAYFLDIFVLSLFLGKRISLSEK